MGGPQLVLMVSKDVAAAQEVHRPALAWAEAQDWMVRRANGQQQIEDPDGSRWAIRGRGSTYSYAVSLGLLDEAWSLPESVADDALGPTLAERVSPQLLLTSTAHRQTTGLLPKRRALALTQLDEPDELLLVEWSAPPAADLADRAAAGVRTPRGRCRTRCRPRRSTKNAGIRKPSPWLVSWSAVMRRCISSGSDRRDHVELHLHLSGDGLVANNYPL